MQTGKSLMRSCALVVPENFIQATRDSGYKSLGSALAELVDNAFEAKATNVHITIEKTEGQHPDVCVQVADNGIGMSQDTLWHALQFGWSSRFNQRNSHGRYGMGLPNASLSHARRVRLVSSADGRIAAETYLDVDEVAGGQIASIPQPRVVQESASGNGNASRRGTVVTWQKCDRLINRKLGSVTRKLRAELGRLFRYQIWAHKRIAVNGEPVIPFDPLFMALGANLRGAKAFGPELTFEIAVPRNVDGSKSSVVRVRFSELPIADWHNKSNDEKNASGIAKNAGVSIIRAGREIDTGWFFMGQKRKENYDDWWRCEVRFEPDLDELFGVTHTKQEIHPTEQLLEILTPSIEKIARELNGRARRAFTVVKAEAVRRKSETLAEKFDNLLAPPRSMPARASIFCKQRRRARGRIQGLRYRLRLRDLENELFYQPVLKNGELNVVLNQAHPFVRQIWSHDIANATHSSDIQRNLELLLFAAARSEFSIAPGGKKRQHVECFRRTWSNILATFLS